MTAGLEQTLEAAVPEYMAWLREQDDERDAFTLLEHLRLWLLERANRDERRRAWEAVESLMPTDDALLVNALAVGLLEGHWPRRDRQRMGPRTRALWEEEPD
jgi:hypothetical protein